jgi:hypothetical protein
VCARSMCVCACVRVRGCVRRVCAVCAYVRVCGREGVCGRVWWATGVCKICCQEKSPRIGRKRHEVTPTPPFPSYPALPIPYQSPIVNHEPRTTNRDPSEPSNKLARRGARRRFGRANCRPCPFRLASLSFVMREGEVEEKIGSALNTSTSVRLATHMGRAEWDRRPTARLIIIF